MKDYKLDYQKAQYFKWFKDDELVLKVWILFEDESKKENYLCFDMTLGMDEENYKLAKGIHPQETEGHMVNATTFLNMPKGMEVDFDESLHFKTWYNYQIIGVGKRIYQLDHSDIDEHIKLVCEGVYDKNEQIRFARLMQRIFSEELEKGGNV